MVAPSIAAPRHYGDFSANRNNSLKLVSQPKGALHRAPPLWDRCWTKTDLRSATDQLSIAIRAGNHLSSCQQGGVFGWPCPVEAILGYRDSRDAQSPSHGSRGDEMKTVRHFGRDIVLQEGQTLEERLRMMAGKPLPPPSPLRSLCMKLYRLHLGYWALAILRRAAIGIGLRPVWRGVRSLRERSGTRRSIS
jgi:hypothetical protein